MNKDFIKRKSARLPFISMMDQKDELIPLNVGGHKYLVLHSTLQNHPDTVLAKIFDGRTKRPFMFDGAYFIDRNPVLFASILDFYRSEYLPPPSMIGSQLKHEFDYWGIDIAQRDCYLSENEKLRQIARGFQTPFFYLVRLERDEFVDGKSFFSTPDCSYVHRILFPIKHNGYFHEESPKNRTIMYFDETYHPSICVKFSRNRYVLDGDHQEMVLIVSENHLSQNPGLLDKNLFPHHGYNPINCRNKSKN